MIDIIALFFLCRMNGDLARLKGLSVAKWKWLTIAGWFGAEVAGIILGTLLFGKINIENMKDFTALENGNFYGMEAMGLISAFGGYLLVKAALEKKPDTLEEDINKINVNDLRPPEKD